jgi:uncharacterized surface protein with fasciclin (FAS1) repeats
MKCPALAAAATAAVTLSTVIAGCSSSPGGSVPVAAASPGMHATLAAVPARAGAGAAGFAEGAGSTAARPFGSGCASVPARGAGSLAGMAAEPFATAASGNPMLSDLTAAVRKAQLFMSLNAASALTVFAPDNAAFAQIPPAQLAEIQASEPELARILTYQVVVGRVTPAQLASGLTLHTLEGGIIKTAKDGDLYEVNAAHVVCGNVETANATVYIINSVLTP